MNKALVLTTISNDDNSILKKLSYISNLNKVKFIIIGDAKSPKRFNLKNSLYFNLTSQKKINPKISNLIPLNNYARKNLGYLYAIKSGSDYIYETDDDNIPNKNFFSDFKISSYANYSNKIGLINVYNFFLEKKKIWPRGFPLQNINCSEINRTSYKKFSNIYIKQNLVDGNPDVDAIYRLTCKLPIYFKNKKDFIIKKNQWCPFNSQNTIWRKESFPLLYLPFSCSFRMTDIWRSFVAIKIFHSLNWNIVFGKSTALQVRNHHNLINDFSSEVSGYINNLDIINEFNKLKINCSSKKDIPKSMINCYSVLLNMRLIDRYEIKCLKLWLKNFI
jgi:hypothetical protein